MFRAFTQQRMCLEKNEHIGFCGKKMCSNAAEKSYGLCVTCKRAGIKVHRGGCTASLLRSHIPTGPSFQNPGSADPETQQWCPGQVSSCPLGRRTGLSFPKDQWMVLSISVFLPLEKIILKIQSLSWKFPMNELDVVVETFLCLFLRYVVGWRN